MSTYVVSEFNPNTCVMTGKTEVFCADDVHAAVESVLYAKRLRDGRAHLGPTKRVVYASGHGYVIVPDKLQKGLSDAN